MSERQSLPYQPNARSLAMQAANLLSNAVNEGDRAHKEALHRWAQSSALVALALVATAENAPSQPSHTATNSGGTDG